MENGQYLVIVSVSKSVAISWPDGVGLPSVGDELHLEQDGKAYLVKVTTKHWSITPNQDTNKIDTVITIRTQSLPAPGQARASVHPLNI